MCIKWLSFLLTYWQLEQVNQRAFCIKTTLNRCVIRLATTLKRFLCFTLQIYHHKLLWQWNNCESLTFIYFLFFVYYEIFPFIYEIIVSHKAEQFPVKKYKNYHKNNFSYWKIWISLIFHFVNKREREWTEVCA